VAGWALIRVTTIRHRAWLASRLPPRLRRWRRVFPEDAGIGATAHICAHAASLRSRYFGGPEPGFRNFSALADRGGHHDPRNRRSLGSSFAEYELHGEMTASGEPLSARYPRSSPCGTGASCTLRLRGPDHWRPAPRQAIRTHLRAELAPRPRRHPRRGSAVGQGREPRAVRQKKSMIPNGPWCYGPHQHRASRGGPRRCCASFRSLAAEVPLGELAGARGQAVGQQPGRAGKPQSAAPGERGDHGDQDTEDHDRSPSRSFRWPWPGGHRSGRRWTPVPAPVRDRIHRATTTLACSPTQDIGHLADV
jgi:hypothetical protein